MQTTARAIIVQALRLIGVIAANEPGRPADIDLGFNSLNDLLDSWSVNRNTLVASTIETFPLVVGQAAYTIGVGGNFNTVMPMTVEESSFTRYQGVDTPLKSITEEVYSDIPYKPSQGIPGVYWFNRSESLATLTLYPVPAAPMTIQLHSTKPLIAFSGLDAAYILAAGYKDGLQCSLAEAMAPAFEREVPKFVLLQAMKLRKSLKRSNVVVPTMDISQVPAPFQDAGSNGWIS